MINLRLSNTAADRLTIFNARVTEGFEVEPGPVGLEYANVAVTCCFSYIARGCQAAI